MKIYLSVIITFFLAVSAFSQLPGNSASGGQTAPTWTLYKIKGEDFSVELPAAMMRYSDERRWYHSFLNGTFFYVFSDDLSAPVQAKTVLKITGQDKSRLAQDSSYQYADGDGFYHRILIVKTAKRLYTFQVASQISDDPLAERFFSTLIVNGVAPKAAETLIDWRAPQTADPNESPVKTGSPANKSAGNVTDDANKSAVKSTPLVIRSRPVAGYTEEAKFYRISAQAECALFSGLMEK